VVVSRFLKTEHCLSIQSKENRRTYFADFPVDESSVNDNPLSSAFDADLLDSLVSITVLNGLDSLREGAGLFRE
jgi:hypothetical protein